MSEFDLNASPEKILEVKNNDLVKIKYHDRDEVAILRVEYADKAWGKGRLILTTVDSKPDQYNSKIGNSRPPFMEKDRYISNEYSKYIRHLRLTAYPGQDPKSRAVNSREDILEALRSGDYAIG